ncbi:hypothetical protein [Azospirillum argentinense]|uniref:Uncharacterized protein n=1 Tax=Azospirillum brasilense TaxID=192 RepID=A0A4D8Q4B5_AZOBR|nr:hypothetical protein [Azospirillum argentinense]QCO05437.1 hypothetical protein D3867_26185 [Azospirillum argentinense]
MTVYRFSPSRLCFFPDDEVYTDLPADLVEATPEEYAAFLAGPVLGLVLAVGDDGRPVMVAPPPPPAPVPPVISDRQFFQALAMDGYITTAEALAAVRTGDLPAVLADLLDHMDGDERFGAEMLLSGATEFRRDHAMTIVIGEARGLTPAEVDDFFRRAAAL